MSKSMKKIEQFDIALQLAGFNFNKQAVHLIIDLYELTKRKGGGATLEDVLNIIADNQHQYEEKK